MENTGYIALSLQSALKQQMDVVANNLANMNSTAYKGEKVLFTEHLIQTADNKLVTLVQDLAVVRDLQQGPMAASHNDLDLAIRGDGYFTIDTAAGERFTRRGAFTLNEQGQIVTLEGDPLLNAGGSPISLPTDARAITIARDGTVSTEQGEIGRISLVRFEDQHLLTKTGDGLFDAGDAEPEPVGDPDIVQGMLEGSNVHGVAEMTLMIDTVRSYQMAASLAQSEDERQRNAIELLVSA